MHLKDRWVNLIYKTATGSRKLRLLITPIAGLSYILFASLFIVVSFVADNLLHLPRLPSGPIGWLLSVCLICLGLLLMSWSVLHFLKVRGTPVPFNPPTKLVTSGPYAYVRNPMLSGIFILLFGIGAAFHSIALVFIFTPLFILINVIELKTIEEPELEMRLGQKYIDYKKKTPMFFPFKKF